MIVQTLKISTLYSFNFYLKSFLTDNYIYFPIIINYPKYITLNLTLINRQQLTKYSKKINVYNLTITKIKKMQKNKTHRIISISPSHNSSLKNPQPSLPSQQLKSSTPIKPFVAHTRTNTNIINTNRSTAFRCDQSINEDQKGGNTNTNANTHCKAMENSMRRHVNVEYQQNCKQRQNKQSKESKQKCKQNKIAAFKIDEILHRIGKTYQSDKPNSTTQLLKKTQISFLREYIRQAKLLISESDSSTNPLNINSPGMQRIQKISHNLHEQISTYFSNLHKSLYKKQKELYQQLEQKIFALKQKNITKSYQIATLKNYIQKCQSDININYQEIINKIQIKQVNQIVDSYVKRLQFYMEKVKVKENIKIVFENKEKEKEEGEGGEIGGWGNGVKIVCYDQNREEGVEGSELEGRMSHHFNNLQVNSNRQSTEKHKIQPPVPRLTLQKSQKLQQILQQTQNISLSKILSKKSKPIKNEDQPRIASARGKY